MKKRDYISWIFIGLSVISIILSFLIFEDFAAQLMIVIPTLLIIVIIVVRNLEKSGFRAILTAAYPLLIAFGKLLKNTKPILNITEWYNAAICFVLARFDPDLSYNLSSEKSLIVSFWILFAIVMGISSLLDSPTLGEHKGREKEEFREKNYSERLTDFCKYLQQSLESINRATNWNESLFTPLDAEVEINIKGRRKKKYKDLLKCLKKTKHGNGVFLVLGDPGSGKSVALRKLCLELLKEVKKSKKVPVYVNLKDWDQDWNADNLPERRDLVSFIEESLRSDGDYFTDSFLDDYFCKMLENSRWYFVFDSFDEMPCLMGKNNCNELIDRISELLHSFLTGPNQCGGVVASRQFKSPSDSIDSSYILRIQDFNEIKIKEMLRKYFNKDSNSVAKILFSEREDLVQLSRNPFHLSLLIEFIKSHGGTFPKSQMEMFSEFINSRLNRCGGKIEREGLTIPEVIQAASKLSVFMQSSSKRGLEASITELSTWINDWQYWNKITNILDYSKICRTGNNNNTVSFVHRRFQEFFVVKHIMDQSTPIISLDYNCILNNTGLRDALVLYCEIAEDSEAFGIAQFCVDAIKRNKDCIDTLRPETQRLICAIQFLSEAFRNRKTILCPLIDEIKSIFTSIVDNSENVHFTVLYSISASLCLFDEKYIQRIVLKLFSLGSSWINNKLLENCRLLKNQIDRRIEIGFIRLITLLDFKQMIGSFRNTQFAFSMAEKYRRIRIYHFLLMIERIVGRITPVLVFPASFYIFLLHNKMSASADTNFWSRSVQEFGFPLWTLIIIIVPMLIFSGFLEPIKEKNALMKGKRGIRKPLEFIDSLFTKKLGLVVFEIVYLPYSIVFWALNDFIRIQRSNLKINSLYVIVIISVILLYLLWFVLSCMILSLYLSFFFNHIKKIYGFLQKNLSLHILKRVFSYILSKMKERLNLITKFFAVLIMIVFLTIILEKASAKFPEFFRILLLIFAGTFSLSFVSFYFYELIKDRRVLKEEARPQQMNRADVIRVLSNLYYFSSQKTFLESLLKNKTKLEGEWPEEWQKSITRDCAGLIAKIECLGIDMPIHL